MRVREAKAYARDTATGLDPMPLTLTLSDEDAAEIIEALECHTIEFLPEFREKALSLIARLSQKGDQTGVGEAIKDVLGTNAALTPQGNQARKVAQELLKKIGAT
jgi:hypothetical protein